MTPETEIRERLKSDPDFICNRRYGYSLNKLLARFPEGVPPKVAARSLMMTEEELSDLEAKVIDKLRKKLKVK